MPTKAKSRSAPAQVFGPSLTRQTDLVLTDVPSSTPPDFANMCVVWGTATTQPATFGDLANSHSALLTTCDEVVYEELDAGPHYKSITAKGVDITGSAGLHLWFGFCGTVGTPISGTAIDAVAAAGVILA